ncbi:MAG TPA: hypothetical protein VGF26_01220, partial [Ramlibacter sp.]
MNATASPSPRTRLVQMFEQVVLPKNSTRIPDFYTPDFELHTNGHSQGYADFLRGHEQVYATGIRSAVRYDEASWVESDARVAVRMWITTRRPGEAANEIEVMLI